MMPMIALFDIVPGHIARDVGSDNGIKTRPVDISMKFYLASYSGTASDGMNYKEWGGDASLFLLIPEIKDLINCYPIKTIDIRLANGDRLRIFDINKDRMLRI